MNFAGQITAGEVLTKNLLCRLNKKAWWFGVKGHLMVIKRREQTSAHNLFDKENRTVVFIPKNAVTDHIKFQNDFEVTMNASVYKIEFNYPFP